MCSPGRAVRDAQSGTRSPGAPQTGAALGGTITVDDVEVSHH